MSKHALAFIMALVLLAAAGCSPNEKAKSPALIADPGPIQATPTPLPTLEPPESEYEHYLLLLETKTYKDALDDIDFGDSSLPEEAKKAAAESSSMYDRLDAVRLLIEIDSRSGSGKWDNSKEFAYKLLDEIDFSDTSFWDFVLKRDGGYMIYGLHAKLSATLSDADDERIMAYITKVTSQLNVENEDPFADHEPNPNPPPRSYLKHGLTEMLFNDLDRFYKFAPEMLKNQMLGDMYDDIAFAEKPAENMKTLDEKLAFYDYYVKNLYDLIPKPEQDPTRADMPYRFKQSQFTFDLDPSQFDLSKYELNSTPVPGKKLGKLLIVRKYYWPDIVSERDPKTELDVDAMLSFPKEYIPLSLSEVESVVYITTFFTHAFNYDSTNLPAYRSQDFIFIFDYKTGEQIASLGMTEGLPPSSTWTSSKEKAFIAPAPSIKTFGAILEYAGLIDSEQRKKFY